MTAPCRRACWRSDAWLRPRPSFTGGRGVTSSQLCVCAYLSRMRFKVCLSSTSSARSMNTCRQPQNRQQQHHIVYELQGHAWTARCLHQASHWLAHVRLLHCAACMPPEPHQHTQHTHAVNVSHTIHCFPCFSCLSTNTDVAFSSAASQAQPPCVNTHIPCREVSWPCCLSCC